MHSIECVEKAVHSRWLLFYIYTDTHSGDSLIAQRILWNV